MTNNKLFRLFVLMSLLVLTLSLLNHNLVTQAQSSVTVQIRANGAETNQATPFAFIVRNSGTSAVSGLSVRIYFTTENGNAGSAYVLEKYWDQSGVATVSAPTLASGSTYYFTVSYGTTSLAAGASWEFQTALHLASWATTYSGTNDWYHTGYALNALPAANTTTNNIPAYINGTRVSGSEPGGGTAVPTTSRTNTPSVPTNTPGGPTRTRTNTPSRTNTPTRTPTRTNTPVGPTNTPTRTPTQGTINPGNQVGYSTQNGGTTGGAGGVTVNASTGTQIHQAICGRASRTTPIIIRVSGTINHGNTTQASGNCSTAADKIEIKDVSNISIIGVGTTAIFDQLGIHIRNASNIIIQNVHVRNVKKSGSPISNGGDAIGMETNVRNVWVDHVTLEASGGESEGFDGLFDLKDNTQYVTLSWSILKNSERGGLVGSGDSDSANNFITYHHNHFQNLNSRVPLLRFATAHAFNNYYNGIVESGMNPRIGGRIKAENNYFTNALNPLGTFYTDDMGFWDVSGNIWGPGVTWSAPGSDMHPAGPNVVSTTSISIPYSYSLDPAANVPSIVTSGAGVGKIN